MILGLDFQSLGLQVFSGGIPEGYHRGGGLSG